MGRPDVGEGLQAAGMLLPPGVAADSGTGDGTRGGLEGVDDDLSKAPNADAGEGLG